MDKLDHHSSRFHYNDCIATRHGVFGVAITVGDITDQKLAVTCHLWDHILAVLYFQKAVGLITDPDLGEW